MVRAEADSVTGWGWRGAWRAGCSADVRIVRAYSMARSGSALEGQRRLGCARRIELREAVGWLNCHRRKPQVPGTPRCASIGGGGDCGGRAPVRVRRGCARVSGRAPDWEERREQTAPEPPLRSIGGGGAGCDRPCAEQRWAVLASAKREVGSPALAGGWRAGHLGVVVVGAIFLKEKFPLALGRRLLGCRQMFFCRKKFVGLHSEECARISMREGCDAFC